MNQLSWLRVLALNKLLLPTACPLAWLCFQSNCPVPGARLLELPKTTSEGLLSWWTKGTVVVEGEDREGQRPPCNDPSSDHSRRSPTSTFLPRRAPVRRSTAVLLEKPAIHHCLSARALPPVSARGTSYGLPVCIDRRESGCVSSGIGAVGRPGWADLSVHLRGPVQRGDKSLSGRARLCTGGPASLARLRGTNGPPHELLCPCP